jgi:methionyl-tRNA formyltransferase
MNVVLFGCKDTTLHLAKFLFKLGLKIDLITISPTKAKINKVAGYLDLTLNSDLFSSINVVENYNLKNPNDLSNIKKIKNLNLGFCMGWQRLISEEILNCFNIGIFGMHGSSRGLPYGKGRSPMNWAIIEGYKLFHTSLFKYESGIDDGPIVDTCSFSVNSGDTAETMHYKNTIAMCDLIQKNLEKLTNGTMEINKQKISEGESFYPKRCPADGIIDWRDNIFNIERLIRATTNPFHGAFSFCSGVEIKIIQAAIFYTDVENHPFKTAPYGKILEIFPNKKFLVRCSGGVLMVHEYRGGNLSEESKFDVLDKSSFNRNIYGFYDV